MTSYAQTLMQANVETLKNPNWNLMDNEDRLLHACLCAYLKGSSMIASDELAWGWVQDIMHNAICNSQGDNQFTQWCDRMELT